jgi:hypothetical protein
MEEIFQRGYYVTTAAHNCFVPLPFNGTDRLPTLKNMKKSGKSVVDPAFESSRSTPKNLKLMTNLLLRAYDIFPTLLSATIEERIFITFVKELVQFDNILTLSRSIIKLIFF